MFSYMWCRVVAIRMIFIINKSFYNLMNILFEEHQPTMQHVYQLQSSAFLHFTIIRKQLCSVTVAQRIVCVKLNAIFSSISIRKSWLHVFTPVYWWLLWVKYPRQECKHAICQQPTDCKKEKSERDLFVIIDPAVALNATLAPPVDTCWVQNSPKDNWTRYRAKDPKRDRLYTKSQSSLFLCYTPIRDGI